LPVSRSPSPDIKLPAGFIYPAISESSSNSSSSDDGLEAKRLKIDPDYIPSTASESPLTAANSQEVSEEENEKQLTEQAETETEEESWAPSRSTSPEIISSPEDD
jgi:hypothetical protein